MATNEEEFRPEVYHIPPNFKEAGGVLGGRVGKRNAIELALIGGPIAFLEFKIMPALHWSLQTEIIVAMVTLIPLAYICAFGFQGETLTQILFAYFRFVKKKRVLSYNSFSMGTSGTSVETKKDKFLENVATVGLVKAITLLTDPSQAVAIDADRFDKPYEESVATEEKTRPDLAQKLRNLQEKWESDVDEEEDEPIAEPVKKKKKKSSTGWLISGAKREELLHKLELGEDDDYY